MAGTSNDIHSDLRVNRQCMQFILLLRRCRSIKGPGDCGNWSSLDGDWDPDAGSCSACQQFMGTHIQTEVGLNCQIDIQNTMSDVQHDGQNTMSGVQYYICAYRIIKDIDTRLTQQQQHRTYSGYPGPQCRLSWHWVQSCLRRSRRRP